jgi:phosphoglycolate phosphatase-like HAD superfamily hydrolase
LTPNPARTLVLFDIDGTLVITGGAGGRAMSLAFEDLFSIPDGFRGIPMPGRTDAWILSDAAAIHGIPADSPALARFPDVYLCHLEREIQRPSPRTFIMPGVTALLDALARADDVCVALLTGNYETTARVKLEHFDLWRHFRAGAFGDGARDRNSLVPKALARVAADGGPLFGPRDTVVIGDTPLDVACAAASGARSIAVATGSYSVDDLRAAGADVVFEDLSDTATVLQAIADRSRHPKSEANL